MSNDATLAPIYAAPKQLKKLFNIGLTTLHRIERGRHRHARGWPKPRTFGGRKLYDVAAIKAFLDALPEGERNARQPPRRKIAP